MASMTVKQKREPSNAKKLVSRHRVRERIQQMILDGRYEPGGKLNQKDLAEKFRVSQAVVREALLELQVCGLVETIDNRGVFVGELDAQKILESYDVREVHEGLAARLCVETITRAQVRSLKEMAEQIFELDKIGEAEQMALLDREFHQQLLRLSGNSMLIRLADNYWVLGKVIRIGRDPKVVCKEHLAILDAIETNKPEKAEKLMREHIRVGKTMAQELINKGQFVPQWIRREKKR